MILVDDILIQVVNHFIIHPDICTDSYTVAATEKSLVLHNALGMEFCWKMLCSELVSCMGTIWRRVGMAVSDMDVKYPTSTLQVLVSVG